MAHGAVAFLWIRCNNIINLTRGGIAVTYKMVVAIINDEDWAQLSDALIREGFSATRLSSTGSFLRKGNTTLLLGLEENDIPRALDILREQCQSRQQLIPQFLLAEPGMEPNILSSLSVNVGGATVFVVDLEQFIKL